MDEKKKRRWAYAPTHSATVKVIVFILCILMLCVAAVSAFGAFFMWETDVYSHSEDYLRGMIYENVLPWYATDILLYVADGDLERLEIYLDQTNIGRVQVSGGGYDIDMSLKPTDDRYFAQVHIPYNDENGTAQESVTVTITPASELTMPDKVYWSNILVHIMYALKYWIYPIGIGGLLIAVLCFVFLMCAAGKRWGVEEVTASELTKVPFEIPTFLTAVLAVGCLLIASLGDDSGGEFVFFIVAAVMCVVFAVGLLFWLMSFAIRVKLGTLFKNTIIYRILRYIFLSVCHIRRSTVKFVRSIPLVWKTVLIVGLLIFAELVAMVLLLPYYTFVFILLWIVSRIVLAVAVICVSRMLKDLQKCGEAIASGDFEKKIDTRDLIFDFKRHGEDLNRISEGINNAVEERLKSERMKTELITNVSHDIKTPLTSIINYSDLICREECDNENIKEYAAVLHNQSERMKRLIDDLVEVSKASSGNLDVLLAECDAKVLVSQAVGEYSQRLSEAGLELVCILPENELKIMADGRRMWRVFDNLMNNARKYALPGTRVYLNLEDIGGKAVFSFKNVSREPLTVNADELSERFVRGDASRNTEGNGLGLSIAKSLTELQGGKFEIKIDGDLFKVILKFEKVK
ncbi:MAG: sensor histidine kinase [Eubacteriales bacterium]